MLPSKSMFDNIATNCHTYGRRDSQASYKPTLRHERKPVTQNIRCSITTLTMGKLISQFPLIFTEM